MNPVFVHVSEEFSIYAAGFFDADGHVRTSDQAGYTYVQVTIAQRHPGLMSLFEDKWGGSRYYAKDDCCFWRISGDDAKRFLTSISPYVKLKHEEVAIALAILNVGSSRGNLKNQFIKAVLAGKLIEAAERRREQAFDRG